MRTLANMALLAVSAMTQKLIWLRYFSYGHSWPLLIWCSSCTYNIFVTFHAQKPADLEGTCPFTVMEKPCPYGLTCRFFGTHKDIHAPSENHEINPLTKDIQKLLWKTKYKFPRASAQIKHLGLKVHTQVFLNSIVYLVYLLPFFLRCSYAC